MLSRDEISSKILKASLEALEYNSNEILEVFAQSQECMPDTNHMSYYFDGNNLQEKRSYEGTKNINSELESFAEKIKYQTGKKVEIKSRPYLTKKQKGFKITDKMLRISLNQREKIEIYFFIPEKVAQ